MPHVIVKLYPGRSEEQKTRLAEEIVKDVIAIAKCEEKSVSVAFEEVNLRNGQRKSIDRTFLITTKGFTRNPAITHLNSPGVYQTDDLQDLQGKRKKSHSDSLQWPAYEEAAADLSRLTITVANPVLSTPRNTGCRLLISIRLDRPQGRLAKLRSLLLIFLRLRTRREPPVFPKVNFTDCKQRGLY